MLLHSANVSSLVMPKVMASPITGGYKYHPSGINEKGSGTGHVIYRFKDFLNDWLDQKLQTAEALGEGIEVIGTP